MSGGNAVNAPLPMGESEAYPRNEFAPNFLEGYKS
jgi:hypothetical protein